MMMLNIRTISCFVVMTAVLPLLTGCDVIYGWLDKEGAEEKELVGEIVVFEQNYTVKEIQTLLEIYGYEPGKPDGILGTKTRDAIEEFQKDLGLKPSRFMDDETWQALIVFKDYQLVVDNKLNIRLIQEILAAAGYEPGTIDGKLGPQTKRAVLKFQEDAGLAPDGKIGYKTLTRLSEYLTFD